MRTPIVAATILFSALCHESVQGAQRFRFIDATSSSRFFTPRTQGGHGVQCADATGDGWVDNCPLKSVEYPLLEDSLIY